MLKATHLVVLGIHALGQSAFGGETAATEHVDDGERVESCSEDSVSGTETCPHHTHRVYLTRPCTHTWTLSMSCFQQS